MKEKIKKFIYKLNYKVFMRNFILMESNPDFCDNTYAVFLEMLNRNVNKKHKIIWFVNDAKKFKNLKYNNVEFLERDGKVLNKLRFLYYNFFAKYIVDCNKYINKRNYNQFRIHLTHGEFLKIAEDYCAGVGEYDYILQCAPFFAKYTQKYFGASEDKILFLGYPRNDDLFEVNDDALKFKKNINATKIIAWIPTFRNHFGYKNVENSTNYLNIKFKYGIPCIDTKEQLIELNTVLQKNDIKLLIKLHPAEDVSELIEIKLSNIIFINDINLTDSYLNLYKFLSICDALITDYSSIYFDFLLTKKAIGLAIGDIDEYTKHYKLFTNDYEKEVAGEYIYDFDGLLTFINNVIIDNDVSYEDRLSKLNLYHLYKDGNSAKRVTDFFLKEIGYKDDEK